MPDITMCDNKKCCLSNKCARFMAIPNEYRQAYFVDPKGGEDCRYFWDVKEGTPFRLKEVDDENLPS